MNIDYHQMQNLEKDIFADSLAAGKLEKLHLTNGRITDFPFEAFQVFYANFIIKL